MRHLKKIGMSYFQHMRQAFLYSFTAFEAGFIFFIHGIFPHIFETTGSEIINNLNSRIMFLQNVKNH